MEACGAITAVGKVEEAKTQPGSSPDDQWDAMDRPHRRLWRDLPERYGKWSSVASRFYRWQKAGVWQWMLAAPQSEAQSNGQINWEVHFVDGTVIRAHQHAVGAKKQP